MSYTLQYHAESPNVQPSEAADIIQYLADWQSGDTNPNDGMNRFGGVAYDHDRNGLRVTCYVEEIPEDKAPQGIKADYDNLVQQANTEFGTEFPLPSEEAQIQSRG